MKIGALIVLPTLLVSVVAADANEIRPYHGDDCGWTKGAWQSFGRRSRDPNSFIQVDFPDAYATSGSIAITGYVRNTVVWQTVGVFQCSNGASICTATFETKDGKTLSTDIETIDALSGEKYLVLPSLSQHEYYSAGFALKVDNRERFDNKRTFNANQFVLVGCAEAVNRAYTSIEPAWKFLDVKSEIRGESDTVVDEILYENGYCQIKGQGISFNYKPAGQHHLTAKLPILTFYADFLNKEHRSAILQVDNKDPDLVILTDDGGYLGEHHYIRYSERLIHDLAKGQSFTVSVNQENLDTVSLDGSAAPVRQFLRCIEKYK